MISDPQSTTSPKSVQIFNPIDHSGWDDQLKNFSQNSFFHSTAWLRVLHETYGFRPIAIAIDNPDRPRALLVTMEVNSWLTGKRGISLPFTDACEPLFSDPADLDELYKSALSIAAQRNWRTLEIRTGTGYSKNQTPSLRYYAHHLDLRSAPQELFKSFSSSNRRAIRKAECSDLEAHRSQSLRNLKSFYSLLCLTRKRHGLPPQPWSFFQAIHQHILSQGKGSLFIASHQSKPIAGALFLHQGNTAIYKFGASDGNFQAMRPNNLVMWSAVKFLAQNNYHAIDFGRTSLENKGLRRFKLGWGSIEQTITYIRRNIKTQTVEIQSDQAQGWHNQIFKILPIPLSRLAGQILYKHVA